MTSSLPTRRGPLSTRAHLVLLVVLLLVPVLVFAGVLLVRFAAAERARVEQGTLAAARQAVVAVDRHLAELQSSLQTLSTSRLIAERDFAGFYRQLLDARAFAGTDIVLRDLDGQQVVSTRRPFGAPLPRTPLEGDRDAIASKRPVASNGFVGAVADRALYAVIAPVLIDGEVRYLLSYSPPAERLAAIIRPEGAPNLVTAVVGRDGRLIARAPGEESALRPVTEAFIEATRNGEGVWTGLNRDGQNVVVGYVRSGLSGWLVSASLPRGAVEAPLRRSLQALALFGGVALALSLALAVWFGRRFAQPIRALADNAAALGRGEPVSPARAPVREIMQVADALSAASVGLRERRAALQTERTRAEASAAERAAILGQLAEGVIVTDPAGRIVFVNEAAARLHGVERLDVAPEDYSKTYHLYTLDGEPYPPGDLPLARAVLQGETVTEARWRIRRADGTEVLAVGNARPVLAPDGARIGAVLTLRDDTARDAAERALRESEGRLRALADNLPSGMVYQIVMNRDGGNRRFTYVSQSCQRLMGLSAEVATADPAALYDTIAPEAREALAAAEAEAIRDLKPFDHEAPFRRHDTGEARWCRIVSAPQVLDDGSLVWDGLLIDITESHRIEQALRERETELARVQRIGQVGGLEVDLRQGFRNRRSPEYLRLHGLPPEAERESHEDWVRRLHPDDRERVERDFKATVKGDARRYEAEYRIIRPSDGETRWISAKAEIERDGSGRALRLVGAHIDVTERKQAEEAVRRLNETLETQVEERTAQLAQLQKLESIGQLTGGVAHDFNNLLMAVLGSLELLKKRLPDDPRAQRLLDNAVQGAERGAALTQRLLAFARRQELKPEAVDVPALMRGMSDLLKRSLGPLVEIETRFPRHLAPALADANQLELAILNLAVNARDAMPRGGRLTISAREERVVGEAGGLPAGAYVVVAVGDTGEGMDEATLRRATEPFFTTKGLGKGTGLGLSMVHGLAAQSGGRLALHSRPGEGTIAELWLPRAEIASPAAPGPRTATAERRAPSRSVLVVDDDPLVLAGTADMLEDMGHAVIEASSARQALEILRAGAAVEVVVTDHAMPGMTGVELAAAIAALRPDLPVILATGYAELPEGVGPGLPRLAKPFRQDALAQVIDAALAAPGDTTTVVPFRRG